MIEKLVLWKNANHFNCPKFLNGYKAAPVFIKTPFYLHVHFHPLNTSLLVWLSKNNNLLLACFQTAQFKILLMNPVPNAKNR